MASEQRVRIVDPVDNTDKWITLAEYLDRFTDRLTPLSVGRCFRFRMENALDIDPNYTEREAIDRMPRGLASAYSRVAEGIVLLLPSAVEVSVTFSGDLLVRIATGG